VIYEVFLALALIWYRSPRSGSFNMRDIVDYQAENPLVRRPAVLRLLYLLYRRPAWR
jgi:hypothetical protein